MAKMKPLDWIAYFLLVIGGINWGLVGLFSYNLVDGLFGAGSIIAKIVYILVGVSGLYGFWTAIKLGFK